MKKILSLIFIVAFVLLMSGCGSRVEGVKVSYEEDIIIIDLEDFVGEYSFGIKYDGPADGSLFYVAEMSKGTAEAQYKLFKLTSLHTIGRVIKNTQKVQVENDLDFKWLGRRDSNSRMQQSKCCVLPLDDSPKIKKDGVEDGTRTHDLQCHKLAL